jgi:hypothetical protein
MLKDEIEREIFKRVEKYRINLTRKTHEPDHKIMITS